MASEGKALSATSMRPDIPYGENLYQIGNLAVDGSEVVDFWYDSIKHFKFDHITVEARKKAQQSTQIIWRASEHLGVAIAKNNKSKGYKTFVLAYYYPIGNFYIGGARNYENNVKRRRK